MIEASLVLVFAYFGVYFWLSGVECGLGLLRLLSGSSLTRHSLRLFRPWWEVINIFLAVGLASLVYFFYDGLVEIRQAALPLLIIGFAILLLRILLVIFLYYGKIKTGMKWPNLLFVLVSFAVPLSFGGAGIRLLIGHNFWQTLGGWAMIASLFAGLLALAMSFVYYSIGLTPHGRIQSLSRSLSALFCVFVALVLQQLVAARQPHLLVASFAIFVLLVAFVVLWQAALWFSARDRYMWWYLSLLAVVSPALLALANQPYLVYSSMSLHRAYGTHAHDDIAIACFGLFLPVILAGFGLLWWRLINRHS